ncbi:nucleotidyltransferase family protein [Algibacter amylolyticus]|uniref:Nucleotidyltransferase family protein n=1 Tax=Algibacter amylolyticus TaxID=1608400 RepID=A0A5M7B3A3_9FLAO|nr:nucleotidyltransferase family protein [Algibacter amylolyticus]KAA5824073.1 nucleotidyltransferase family protein [Algibacter amylolyticus]MBB5269629.1 molybdenum cofactor cytidylyltransferase [Algibacter amylolyticus]TSJ74550.1 nucleotidyltransferase family protein [Algibacter amylolyticus]
MDIAVVILAAGQGSRMGGIKQLLPYKNSTLLQYVIKQTLASDASHVSCVLGAHAQVLKKALTCSNVTIINNPKWELGLSSSISVAVSYLKTLKRLPEGVLFLLADQPQVESNYINEIIDCFKNNKGKIVASNYENGKGVPALFPALYYDELIALKGDKGAKLFLIKNYKSVIGLTPNSKTILFDVDTPEDYKKLRL